MEIKTVRIPENSFNIIPSQSQYSSTFSQYFSFRSAAICTSNRFRNYLFLMLELFICAADWLFRQLHYLYSPGSSFYPIQTWQIVDISASLACKLFDKCLYLLFQTNWTNLVLVFFFHLLPLSTYRIRLKVCYIPLFDIDNFIIVAWALAHSVSKLFECLRILVDVLYTFVISNFFFEHILLKSPFSIPFVENYVIDKCLFTWTLCH